jgi:protein TonB
MRFLYRVISAFVATTALALSCQTLTYADPSPSPTTSPSTAVPPVMEAPSPPPGAAKPTCPEVPVFTSRDGKTYVVAFSDRSVFSGTVAMTIYTANNTYAANIPIAVALPGHDSDYRSLPFTIANPASDPFLAAEIDFAGTRPIPGGCVIRSRLSDLTQSDEDVRAAYAGLDPSRPPTQLLKVIGEGMTLTCKDPYASARLDQAARLDYPMMAREMGQTGTTLVKVSLTDTGAVDAVSIYRSSGSTYLDQAAIHAAQQSQYRPQLFRCEPVAGAFLFKANFNMGSN